MKRLWDDKEIIALIQQVIEQTIDLSDFVTKSTKQTITGHKTITNNLTMGDRNYNPLIIIFINVILLLKLQKNLIHLIGLQQH